MKNLVINGKSKLKVLNKKIMITKKNRQLKIIMIKNLLAILAL